MEATSKGVTGTAGGVAASSARFAEPALSAIPSNAMANDGFELIGLDTNRIRT